MNTVITSKNSKSQSNPVQGSESVSKNHLGNNFDMIEKNLDFEMDHRPTESLEHKAPIGCNPKHLLPAEYKPSAYSVIIGRGKSCTGAVGNRRLRVIASTFLPTYSKATTKNDKTEIVTRLVEIVYDACPTGAFVKQVGGRWWEVDGHTAREKVGYVLRELLHDKYRSSSKSKVQKRRQERQIKRQRWAVSNKIHAKHVTSYDGSTATPSNEMEVPAVQPMVDHDLSTSFLNNDIRMRALPDNLQSTKLLCHDRSVSTLTPCRLLEKGIQASRWHRKLQLNACAANSQTLNCAPLSYNGLHFTNTNQWNDKNWEKQACEQVNQLMESTTDLCKQILNEQQCIDRLVSSMDFHGTEDLSDVFE